MSIPHSIFSCTRSHISKVGQSLDLSLYLAAGGLMKEDNPYVTAQKISAICHKIRGKV